MPSMLPDPTSNEEPGYLKRGQRDWEGLLLKSAPIDSPGPGLTCARDFRRQPSQGSWHEGARVDNQSVRICHSPQYE